MTLLEMQKKRAEVKAAGKKILADAKAEGRDMTAEELAKVEALGAEKTTLDEQIETAEKRKLSTEWLDTPDPEIKPAPKAPKMAEGRKFPDAVLRHRSPMKAFFGEDAAQRAYTCGRWIHAALFGNKNSERWCLDNGVEIAATLQEGVNSAGGYLVPNEFETAIVDLREQWGVARRLCKRYPMGSDTKSFPIKVSGLTAYHVLEGATGTASQAVFAQGLLVAKTVQTETPYSNDLSEDAFIDIANDIAMDAAKATAYAEDNDCFNGDGTATYGGIRGIKNAIADGTHTASIVDAVSGNTAFSTLDLADFENVVGAYPQFPGANPVWVISKAGWAASMQRLALASGGTSAMEMVNGVPQAVFLGYPVVWTAQNIALSALTAQSDAVLACYFGDFSLSSAFGDRRGMTMTSDPYSRMKYRETTLFTTQRYDIVHHSLGTTSAAGPVLALAFNS